MLKKLALNVFYDFENEKSNKRSLLETVSLMLSITLPISLPPDYANKNHLFVWLMTRINYVLLSFFTQCININPIPVGLLRAAQG